MFSGCIVGKAFSQEKADSSEFKAPQIRLGAGTGFVVPLGNLQQFSSGFSINGNFEYNYSPSLKFVSTIQYMQFGIKPFRGTEADLRTLTRFDVSVNAGVQYHLHDFILHAATFVQTIVEEEEIFQSNTITFSQHSGFTVGAGYRFGIVDVLGTYSFIIRPSGSFGVRLESFAGVTAYVRFFNIQ